MYTPDRRRTQQQLGNRRWVLVRIMAKKKIVLKTALKGTVVIVCTVGFLWQTLEFFFLYQTYPTVVDIQVTVPSEIDIPGITLCSGNGIVPEAICVIQIANLHLDSLIVPEAVCKLGGTCSREKMFKFFNPCPSYPDLCDDNKLPKGFTAVRYFSFMKTAYLNKSALDLLRVPLNDFFICKIVGGANERDCDTENVVIGSYYSDTYSPNFCFSLNTRWGDPNKKLQRIKKSERIQMKFIMDTNSRNLSYPDDVVQRPKYNPLSSNIVQMAIHSQEFSASPYVSGQGFMGGKKYHIKLKKEEKHLLPPPYQTNCTDYTKNWLSRGGIGPLNQLMMIQECRMNASIKELECVPYFIDFPHNKTLCPYCDKNCSRIKKVGDNCTNLLNFYNQPCDSSTYQMAIEEKFVYLVRTFISGFMASQEDLILKQKGYNCTFERVFARECQTVNIELDFDEYEVTNMTYNPKFESLELFSVIGGYMGMYLGISLVAVYDFLEMALSASCVFLKKNKNVKRKAIKKDSRRNARDTYNGYNYNASEFRRRTVSPWVKKF